MLIRCLPLAGSLGNVAVSGGYTYYNFPIYGELFSREYYLGFAFDTYMAPSITYYRDYDLDTNYVALDAGSAVFSVDALLDLTFSGHLGYTSFDGEGGDTVMDGDVAVSTTLALSMSEGLTLFPVFVFYCAVRGPY